MKHTSKTVRVGLVVAAAAILLAGCSATPSSGNASGKHVTLNYAIWDQSQKPTFDKMVAKFEKENPNISVDIQVTSNANYWTKLQTEAGNNDLPDVFWMNPFNFPLYASQGELAPLDNQIKSAGFDAKAIPASMRQTYTYNKKLYALPNNRDAIVVWYNKALLSAAGVSEPKTGWTWQDFSSDAQKLTDPSKGVYGTASGLNFRELWVTTIHQAGGTVLSSDAKKAEWTSSATKQGMQYWLDMTQKGYTPTVDQLATTDQYSMFLSGKVGMLYAGSWLGVSFAESQLAKDGNIGVAVLPKGPDNNASPTSALGNVIGKDTKHPAAAYKFVQFLGSKEAADIYTKGGIALSAYPQYDKNFVNHFAKSFDASAIAKQIGNTFPLPVSKNSSVWMNQINPDLSPVFTGAKSLDDGLTTLNKDMQTDLNAEAGQ